MSETLRERQKAEAIKRLELMDIREDVRKAFQKNGTVMLCDSGDYCPVDDAMREDIRKFEREHNAIVYLAVRTESMFGELDALLFVGKYEEEWEMECADLIDGYAMSYVINRDYPECSELGSICFRVTYGGVIIREG